MDALLVAALGGPAPVGVHLVTVTLPDHTLRWTDGGFVMWGSDLYEEVDETYGPLGDMEAFEDGASDSATDWVLTFMPPPEAASDLIAYEAQGSLVTVHLGAVDRATGLLIGEPELLQRAELDQPRLAVGKGFAIAYGCITEEARMLEPNQEQRLTDAFHQSVWPGELGYEYVTDATKKIYWRADDPNNAIT